ncbi:TraR/DksA C4-type zinc finger protein [Shewanella baltica]|uniref:TraR/DksA C4-type zinc finger protein n=1 Tax=Shewanella baltica TaxID=62322 RepID=UPI002169C506|nr:TraR/DksA C4-type zinc finger protein [Shewanella baltica]MCS6113039.1 TraR/DksA family transcriptional regulator [Shewanella baltica]UVW64252.1 TraR/DksA family transcriptional regulator [Shewanella baltica]
MTDLFERAQKSEQEFRDSALSHQLKYMVEKPDFNSQGERCCLGCGLVIEAERLRAMPKAVRCIDCQTAKER